MSNYPESYELEWWPSHVQRAIANLGHVLGPAQLNPDILDRVSHEGLPNHRIIFGHKSGALFGRRKGQYTLLIIGPIFTGQWAFRSGQLEKLARTAAEKFRGAEANPDDLADARSRGFLTRPLSAAKLFIGFKVWLWRLTNSRAEKAPARRRDRIHPAAGEAGRELDRQRRQ
jgi:hypothetical protein